MNEARECRTHRALFTLPVLASQRSERRHEWPVHGLRGQAILGGVDNANARSVRGLRGRTGGAVHSPKNRQTAVVTASTGSVHAVHVPTDTTVIFYTYKRTRQRRGGAVDE